MCFSYKYFTLLEVWAMNGQLHKYDMEARTSKLKNELYERCARHDMTHEECRGAEEYLNKVIDVIDEFGY